MHISALWKVTSLDIRLREKQEQRSSIADGKALGVTINGKYQPDDLLDAVRPIVLAHLDAEIADVTAELTTYGVDLTEVGVG